MRFFISFVFFIFSLIFDCNSSFAFFTENYKKNISYGAFKQINNADLYFGMNVGFVVKTWTPNILTAISPNKDCISYYIDGLPEQISKKTSDNYTYHIGASFGINVHKSILRHELEFNWYGISSKYINVTGSSANINGTNLQYTSIDGRLISSLGVFSHIFKLTYNVYFNFDNVFKLFGQNWDVFIGGGAGFAIVNSGTYIGKEMSRSSGNISGIKDNDVGSATNADDYILHSGKSFAIGYQTKVGILANLSQSFDAGLSFKFSATSRPLFTTKFKYIDKTEGMKSHLEYSVAFEVSILLKTTEIAI